MFKNPFTIRIAIIPFEKKSANVMAVELFFIVKARLHSVEPALIYTPWCLTRPAELLIALIAIHEGLSSFFICKLMTKWAYMVCWTYATFAFRNDFCISSFLFYNYALIFLFGTAHDCFILRNTTLTHHCSTKLTFAIENIFRSINDIMTVFCWTPLIRRI